MSAQVSPEGTMLKTLKRGAIAAAATASLLAFCATAIAAEDCDWYALTSAKQEQQNSERSCGMTGDGWTTDANAHKTWCESVSPDEWKQAVKERQEKLAGCASSG
mgnify:CR=1 FL=1